MWIKRFSVFVFAGLVYLAGQYFHGVWFENFPSLCLYKESSSGAYCNWPYFDSGLSLIIAAQFFAVAGIILLFASAATLRKWLWFSLVYVPLAVIATVYLSQTLTVPPLGRMVSPETITRDFGYLYILLTTVMVAWGRWRAWRAGRAQAAPK